MSNCTIEQPVFTPNFIKGVIQAAPNGKSFPSEIYIFFLKNFQKAEDSDLAHAGIQRKLPCSFG